MRESRVVVRLSIVVDSLWWVWKWEDGRDEKGDVVAGIKKCLLLTGWYSTYLICSGFSQLVRVVLHLASVASPPVCGLRAM